MLTLLPPPAPIYVKLLILELVLVRWSIKMNMNNNARRTGIVNFQHRKKQPPVNMTIFGNDTMEEELGTETEAEKQMKVLLHKQLNTNLSLKQQFGQHKSFTCPSTYTPLTELVKGTCSLERFKQTEKNEELHQELQRSGLSADEIHSYVIFKQNGMKQDRQRVEPGVWHEKIKSIEDKIKAHHDDLCKPQVFSEVKQLSRHEMDLEKTLYAGCMTKCKLSPLVSVTKDRDSDGTNEVFKHIKKISQKLSERGKKGKRKHSPTAPTTTNSTSPILEQCDSDQQDFEYDPNIHHVVVPLDEADVSEKRLSVTEIQKLPRFVNYEAGEPSKVLYLQNLHPKVSLQELQSLFGRFEEENVEPLEYKVMTGRMKGQAFIKFTDSKLAETALNFARGYVLRQKPIIIKYGRKS